MGDVRPISMCKFRRSRLLGLWGRPSILAGVLAAFVAAAGSGDAEEPPAGQVRVLVLEQKAIGVPGQEADRALEQRIVVDETGKRLVLHLFKTEPNSPKVAGQGASKASEAPRTLDRRVILRLDHEPPEIYEVWDAERSYRRTVGDLNRLQEDRDRQEALELRHFGKLTAKEQEDYLKSNFMRRDGKRIVSVAKVGTATILGRPCEEVKVFENDREVIHAWVTRDVPGAKSFFHLYRRLGAFSKEVLDRVESIEGLPLKAEITVVTAAPAYRISAECLSLKTETVPADVFDLPPAYQEKREELEPFVICPGPGCGKKFERDQYGGKFTINNLTLLFCSKTCRARFVEERDKEFKRKKEAELGKDAPPPTPAAPPEKK